LDGIRKITLVIKALSDESRIRIMGLLEASTSLCVCEIREIIGLSQPTISSHLKILENAGLIEHSKQGLWVNYSTSSRMDRDVRALLDSTLAGIRESKALKDDLKRLSNVDRKAICSRKKVV